MTFTSKCYSPMDMPMNHNLFSNLRFHSIKNNNYNILWIHLFCIKRSQHQLFISLLIFIGVSENYSIQGQKLPSWHKNKSTSIVHTTTYIYWCFSKLQHTGANAPVAGGQRVPDGSRILPKEEIVDQKVRCPCGSPVKTEFMIQVFYTI